MKKRVSKFIALFFLVCFIGLIAFSSLFYYLFATTSGLNYLIDKANSLFSDTVKITAKIDNGSVIKGFKTDSYFEVNVIGIVIVRADYLDLKYDAWTVLSRNAFIVDKIDAKKLEVELLDFESSDDDDEDSSPVRVIFPVQVQVKDIILKDFAYLSSVVDVIVPDAVLSADAVDNYAVVTKGTVNNPLVHLKIDTSSQDSTEVKKKLPEILTFGNGNGAIEKIYDIDMPLDAALRNLRLNNARYYMDCYDTGYFDADVSAIFSHALLAVEKVSISHPLGDFSVKGNMNFTDYYSMDFNIEGQGKKTKLTEENYLGFLNDLSGKARVKGDLTDLFLYAGIKKDKDILVKARINSLSDELPFEFRVTTDKLSYPFVKNSSLNEDFNNTVNSFEQFINNLDQEEKDGTILLKESVSKKRTTIAKKVKNKTVSIEDFFFNAKGAIFKTLKVDSNFIYSGAGFDNVKVNLDANMNTMFATINSLTLNGDLSGKPFTSDFSGAVYYKDHKGLEGELTLNAEDAKALHPNLEGKLYASGDVKIGFDAENNYFIDITSIKSDFYLNNNKTELFAKNIKGSSSEGIKVNELKLLQSDNFLALSGSFSDNSNLVGTINIKDLSKFSDKLSGQVFSKVSVKGSLSEPVIILTGQAPSLRYDDFFVRKLVFDTDLDIRRKEIHLSVLTNNLKLNKKVKEYGRCVLDVNGSVSAHTLSFSCGMQSGSYVSAKGGYDSNKKIYSGTLDNMILVTNVIDTVSLVSPVNFKYDFNAKSGNLSDVVLVNGESNLSFSENQIYEKGFKTKFKVKDFEINSLSPLLSEDVKLLGKMNVLADIVYENSSPKIKGNISLEKAILGHKTIVLPFKKALLSLDATDKHYAFTIDGDFVRDLGKLNLDISVLNPYSSRNISGSIKIADLDLSLFVPVSNQINSLTGLANLNASLSGTLKDPLVYGRLSVKGSAEPRMNIGLINEFDVQLDANGNTGQFSGLIKLNDAPLTLKGNLNWQTQKALAHLSLDGDSLPVFLMQYGEATVNVHSVIDINEQLSVRGDIFIPSGIIKFKDLENSSVTPSEDEIILSEKNNINKLQVALKDKQLNNDMNIDVNVALGDKVKVDAMGLKANVVGSLKISKQSTSSLVTGTGTLSLTNGRVEVFGHKFIVNKADAYFRKSLFDPFVDAEVVVDQSTIEDDVTAGVTVKGLASNPHVQLFSKPAMSQNEIMSYLLYGHGLEKTQANTDSNSAALLLTLGMGTTTGVINSIVGIFGMDGVQFGSSGSGDETQLELQTYLTNRIRLSYGYGIYNSVNEFKIRYEIVRKLYAEFISSIDESIDLIYNFELD